MSLINDFIYGMLIGTILFGCGFALATFIVIGLYDELKRRMADEILYLRQFNKPDSK